MTTTKTKQKKAPRFMAIKSRDNDYYGVVCIENQRTGKAKLLYKTVATGNADADADAANTMQKIAAMLNVKITCKDDAIVTQVNTQLDVHKNLLTD